MKKALSLLMAALLLSGSLAACSDAGTNTEDTASGAQQNTPGTAEVADPDNLTNAEARKLIPDNLPDKSFGDRTFNVGTTTVKEYEIVSEELVGEGTNDSVYERNLRLEERFDVDIGTVVVSDPPNDVKTTVLAGTYVYDIIGFNNFQAYTPISETGTLRNWCEFNYVDLTQPWHNALANNDATINGKLFAINSDLSISTLLYTYGMFFNYSIMENYGYTSADLYNIVFEGNWTVDKLKEISSQIWEDTNGNGLHDAEDIHGYAVTGSGVNPHDVWLAALDLPVMSKNAEGVYEATFFSEKTVAALELVNDLYHSSEGSFFDGSGDWRNIPKFFANGKIAMTQLYFGETTESLGEMEDTYGILPMPKMSTEQEAYYTNCWDQFSVFGVPGTMASAEDTEFIGIIYEALCAESYKYVYPAYYDQALKSRYSAEPTTAEIIDLIMAGRKLDFTFQFGEKLQSLPYTFRQMVVNNQTDVASRYQKNKKALKKTIEKVIEMYE